MVAFAGAVAVERVNLGGTVVEVPRLVKELTESTCDYGGAWLQEKGGWQGMPEILPGRLRNPSLQLEQLLVLLGYSKKGWHRQRSVHIHITKYKRNMLTLLTC